MALHAICSADWHLEGLKNHFPHDHIQRQFAEIDKIYQYAIDKGIEHIFVPGDIADTPHLDYGAYISLLNHLQKYDGHINTYYLAGNHDFSDTKKTSLDMLMYLTKKKFFKTFKLFLHPEMIEVDGVNVCMLPHPARATIAESSKPCLNFVHTEVNGAVGDNGRKLRVSREFETGEGDFTISGHIHQHQFISKKRWLFCGNPYQKNFGEALPKGFVEIKAGYQSDELVVKHRFVNNKPDFRLETRLIESQSDFSDLEINPSIRYRIYVDPSLTVPADLRTRIPNIAQVLDSKGKKLDVLEDAEAFVQESIDVPSVDPLFGLKDEFKSGGFKASEYKMGKQIIESVLEELGHDSC